MEIIRKTDISYEDFINNHVKAGVPLIFTNATKNWSGMKEFSLEWFKEKFGDRVTDFEGNKYTMNEVVDLVNKSTPENPAPYPITFDVPKQLPELLEYVNPIDLGYAKPNWLDSNLFQKGHWGYATEIFFGGRGVKFPYVHLDYYHLSAWVTMVVGQKEFTVFPRGQDEYLYPEPGNNFRSDLNIFNPDYEKYPKFKNATPIHFVLNPGETLYIPFGIWHSAHALTPSVSIAFDHLSAENTWPFVKDVYYLKKRMGKVKAFLTAIYAFTACYICRISDVFGIKRQLINERFDPKKIKS